MLSRMWGHYGTTRIGKGKIKEQKMTGACIEFDIEKINQIGKTMQGLSFFDVEYPKTNKDAFLYYKRITSSAETDEEKFSDDVKFKYKDWESEREYRLLFNGDTDAQNIKGIDITNCIKKIYLGADFRYEDLKKICDILADKRYDNITPEKFVKLTVREGGIIINYDNLALCGSQIIDYIRDNFLNYYQELESKYEWVKDLSPVDKFSTLLKNEKKEDEELNKSNAEHWKNKYDELFKADYELLKENRELRIETDELKDKIRGLEKKAAQSDYDAPDAQTETSS